MIMYIMNMTMHSCVGALEHVPAHESKRKASEDCMTVNTLRMSQRERLSTCVGERRSKHGLPTTAWRDRLQVAQQRVGPIHCARIVVHAVELTPRIPNVKKQHVGDMSVVVRQMIIITRATHGRAHLPWHQRRAMASARALRQWCKFSSFSPIQTDTSSPDEPLKKSPSSATHLVSTAGSTKATLTPTVVAALDASRRSSSSLQW